MMRLATRGVPRARSPLTHRSQLVGGILGSPFAVTPVFELLALLSETDQVAHLAWAANVVVRLARRLGGDRGSAGAPTAAGSIGRSGGDARRGGGKRSDGVEDNGGLDARDVDGDGLLGGERIGRLETMAAPAVGVISGVSGARAWTRRAELSASLR